MLRALGWVLVLTLLSAGLAFLFLKHHVSNGMKGRKLTSDAFMTGSALWSYRRNHNDALPSSFSELTFGGVNIADYRHHYDGGRGDDSVSPVGSGDKKIDLEFFTLCPPGARIGKSEKEVFAIGKRKGVALLHVIYVDSKVGFEMER